MITGTADYQSMFQNLLHEVFFVEDRNTLVPIVKLANDSVVNLPGQSADGSIPVTVPQLTSAAFGELLIAPYTPYTGWRFDYGLNQKLVMTSGTVSGGFVTGTSSMAWLRTGANPSGTAEVTTFKRLRYIPGMGGLLRITAVFNIGTANSEQIVGIGDAHDGFFFGYNGTQFGVMRRRAGVDTWIPQSSWNGDTVNFSPQLGNIYQIRFQWLGYGNIYFSVFDKTLQRYVVVHTIEYPNTSMVTHILNPTLPIKAQIKNKGNTSNLSLYSPSAIAGIEGSPESSYGHPLDTFNSFDASLTVSSASNTHVLTIRNKETYNGLVNRIPLQVDSITLSRGAGAAISTFRIYKDAVTSVARTFADVEAGASCAEASTTAATISSGNSERSYPFTTSVTFTEIQFPSGSLVLQPGERLTIAVQNSTAAGTDVVVNVNFRQQN